MNPTTTLLLAGVNAGSGTIELRSTFDNGDLALVPGQLVNVTVELDNLPDALVVDEQAWRRGGHVVCVCCCVCAMCTLAKVFWERTGGVHTHKHTPNTRTDQARKRLHGQRRAHDNQQAVV